MYLNLWCTSFRQKPSDFRVIRNHVKDIEIREHHVVSRNLRPDYVLEI